MRYAGEAPIPPETLSESPMAPFDLSAFLLDTSCGALWRVWAAGRYLCSGPVLIVACGVP
jgi:hypothetical protein